VPPAARASIFQPFQRQGDETGSTSVSGTGLGLAVAHGFVRLMGGEILVEDTPGGGTTMVLLLPEASEPSGPVPGRPTRRDIPAGSEAPPR
jgi:two-component system sensor histidine kinase KdpD